jgi:hypothetical protein
MLYLYDIFSIASCHFCGMSISMQIQSHLLLQIQLDFSYQTFATCSELETLKQILPTTYDDGRISGWSNVVQYLLYERLYYCKSCNEINLQNPKQMFK